MQNHEILNIIRQTISEANNMPQQQPQQQQQVQPNQQNATIVPSTGKLELKTYGDLKKIIDSTIKKQRNLKILNKGKEVAFDQILGTFPLATNIKSGYDFLKAAFSKPDTAKTGTWLDKLGIDDKTSAIVDDTVENGFLQIMTNSLQAQPDNKPLEDNFNMNQQLADYLKKTYGGRFVAMNQGGTNENVKNKNMKKLIIKEEKLTAVINALAEELYNNRIISEKQKWNQEIDSKIETIVEAKLLKKNVIKEANIVPGTQNQTIQSPPPQQPQQQQNAKTPVDVTNLQNTSSKIQPLQTKSKLINTTQEFGSAFQNWFSSLGYNNTKINKNFIKTQVDKILTGLGY